MNNRQLFRKYYGKLAFEGWLKAFMWGFDIACVTIALVLFIGWATAFEASVWIAVGAGVAVCILCTVILYFRVFRPTTQQIARRLDALGLEERMITMAELEKNDSFIAMRQREDATAKLASVDPQRIKVRPLALSDGAPASRRTRALTIAATIVAPFLVAVMVVIYALSIYNVLPSGDEVFHPEPVPTFVLVSYMDGDGGVVEGEQDQIIETGGTTEAVLAVADEGYAFKQWSDGNENPSRSDSNVMEDLFVYPEFVEVNGGSGEGDGDDAGDQPMDEPQESEADEPQDPTDEDDPSAGTNGAYNGQILDGETDYKDVFPQYYDEIMKLLNSGELTSDQIEFLKAYFDSLL